MKLFFSLFISLFFFTAGISQNRTDIKEDVIVKSNGEELRGKIVKIDDESLQFVYSGETLEYTVKKNDIVRIVHSSGRVETFANAAPQSQLKTSQGDKGNKIAVLPFGFLLDQQPGSQEIGYKAQDDTYNFLVKHSAGYTFQDTRTTNSLLIKNNITRDKLRAYTMKEICDILGVKYVVDGTVTQVKSALTSSSSDYSNTNVKRDNSEKVKNVNTYGSNNSYTQQRYEISVKVAIYTDSDATIYNQSHTALFSSVDGSYDAPLEYLLKRSPLYSK